MFAHSFNVSCSLSCTPTGASHILAGRDSATLPPAGASLQLVPTIPRACSSITPIGASQ